MDAFSQSCLDKLNEADGIRKLVDDLAKLKVDDWKTKDPDQDGVLTLLKAMESPLRLEMKKDETAGYKDPVLRVERVVALQDLIAWVEKKPTSFFTGVHPYRVAIQFAARLRRPRIIDQGECGFCGPASILVEVLKRTPNKYIQFATELVQHGKADFWVHYHEALPVELGPTEAADWATAGTRALPEADYVTLRALRTKAELLAKGDPEQVPFDINQGESHATSPEQMALLLRNSGYTDVRDCTVNWYSTTKGSPFDMTTMRRNLEQLIKEQAVDPKHRVVMMLINVPLSDLPRQGLLAKKPQRWPQKYYVEKLMEKYPQLQKRWTVNRLTDAHWITLRSIELSGNQVLMKSVTWKESDILQLDVDLFCEFYYGYVIGTV
jgi:hypothetical protein